MHMAELFHLLQKASITGAVSPANVRRTGRSNPVDDEPPVDPAARGARWVSAGYMMGVAVALLEFGLHWQIATRSLEMGIFLVFLIAISFCLIGVSRHYRVPPPWTGMIVIWIATALASPVLFTLPYGSVPPALLDQLPYAMMQSLIGLVILRSRRQQPLHILLASLSFIVGFIYLLKPALVVWVGTAETPQGYMASNYAAVS